MFDRQEWRKIVLEAKDNNGLQRSRRRKILADIRSTSATPDVKRTGSGKVSDLVLLALWIRTGWHLKLIPHLSNGFDLKLGAQKPNLFDMLCNVQLTLIDFLFILRISHQKCPRMVGKFTWSFADGISGVRSGTKQRYKPKNMTNYLICLRVLL
jgi:hypothetical protein